MGINNKTVKKILCASAASLGGAFAVTSAIALKQKGNSIYNDDPSQKNPLENKKVIFVEDENDPVNADGARGHLEAIGDSNNSKTIYNKYIKRGMDIALSFGGLVALSPIYVAIALAIKIEDPGPVLFTQKRLGENKRYFKLHKFRSMRLDTPHDVPTHMLENPEQYITKIGKFIRAHSLDELPQIWDIFIGNMSVIGPRPGLWNQDVLTAERDKYGANDIKPGLTGLAQINGRDELEIPEKAKLDGEYVKNLSLAMDTKVFLCSLHVFSNDDSVVEGGTGVLNKDKKRKILIATNHSYMLYKFRKEVIAKLLESCDVTLSMPFVGHEDDFANMGCKCINTEIDRRGINPKTDLKLLSQYIKLIDTEKPDMVITYSIKPNIYCGIAARLKKIPYFTNIQGLGTAFQKEPLATVVTQMYKVSASKATTVFFENTANAEIFIDRKIAKKDNITVVNGAGVNLSEYPYTPATEKDIIHFLYLGRIMKEKGIDELLSAYKQIKNEYGDKVTLDVVGFFEDEYKDIIEKMNSDGLIAFHGFQNDAVPYYQNADCIVMPSYHEGLSNVLLEASAIGRPCITTNIPGCKEAVEDNKTGFLVSPKNTAELYEAMKRFINLSSEEKQALGKNARAKIENEFDKNVVVSQVIEKILG